MYYNIAPNIALNEDTQPVIRAIGVSHTRLAKMNFDNIFDLTAGVYFNFYNIASAMGSKHIYIICLM